MDKILVVTNPAHDQVTGYFSAWMEEILVNAKKIPGIKIIELAGKTANRKIFEKVVTEEKPRLIIMNGHGNHDSITGHDNEILVKKDENAEIISGKIVHALSCKSGQALGPHAVTIGTLAYIGYKEDYMFYNDSKYSHPNLKDDPSAALFLNPAFESIKALIEGATAKDAFDRSQKMHLDTILMAVTQGNDTLNQFAAILYHNLENQVLLGEGSNAF